MNLRRLKTLVPLSLLLGFAAAGFLYGTSPDSVGPLGITVFFIIAYLFIAVAFHTTVLALGRFLRKPGTEEQWKLSYSLIAAFLPVAAIGLDSLDQLVLRDVLIFLALFGLLIFYVSRRGGSRS